MGDGYVRFKNSVVAADRMAGTTVIGCAALLSLWLVSQAAPMWSDSPSASAGSALETPLGTLVAAGPLTVADLRTLQSKLEGLGFKPGIDRRHRWWAHLGRSEPLSRSTNVETGFRDRIRDSRRFAGLIPAEETSAI